MNVLHIRQYHYSGPSLGPSTISLLICFRAVLFWKIQKLLCFMHPKALPVWKTVRKALASRCISSALHRYLSLTVYDQRHWWCVTDNIYSLCWVCFRSLDMKRAKQRSLMAQWGLRCRTFCKGKIRCYSAMEWPMQAKRTLFRVKGKIQSSVLCVCVYICVFCV